MRKISYFFGQQVLPGFLARRVNKKVAQSNKNLDHVIVEDIGNPTDLIPQLKSDIENQGERKKGLEDKVKTILFSVSIAITAITFSLTYNKNGFGNVFDTLALALLLVSIYYFISSAAVSLETLMPIQFHLIQTPTDYNEKDNKINLIIENDLLEYKQLVISKYENDSSNLQIANLTYAALKLLRNGIILFSLYFIVALVSKYIHNPFTDRLVIRGVKEIKLNDSTKIALPYQYESESEDAFPLKIDSIEIKRIKLKK